MKAEEINQAIINYRWLAGIVKKYERTLYRLENNKRDIHITGIEFSCCGDPETIDLNTHRTIDPDPFINAIRSCIDSLKQEIEEVKNKYDMIEFEELEPYDM